MTFFVPPPKSLGFWHPATLIATFGGVGLLRPAPGTIGSVAALLVAWGIGSFSSAALLIAMSLAAFAAGIWASDQIEQASGDKDPSSVVIDEVAGQWLALSLLPVTAKAYLIGFALFRLFDIWKPWPASYADQKMTGGLGVMSDDMVAGLYALIGTILLLHVV